LNYNYVKQVIAFDITACYPVAFIYLYRKRSERVASGSKKKKYQLYSINDDMNHDHLSELTDKKQQNPEKM